MPISNTVVKIALSVKALFWNHQIIGRNSNVMRKSTSSYRFESYNKLDESQREKVTEGFATISPNVILLITII